MLVVGTIILFFFFFFPFSSCRAEKYGPIVRLNAFHRVSVMILSPEGVKVLQNKAELTVRIGPSLQKERAARCSQSVPAGRAALAGLGG